MKNFFKLVCVTLIASACNQTPTPSPTPSSSVSPTPSASASSSPSQGPWYKTANGIDLRACDSPVETQQTPWCTAFSITGSLANMVCDKQRLSIHHSWSLYQQYSVDSASEKVPGHNITTWDEWTESASNPKADYLNFAKHQLLPMKYIDTEDDEADDAAVIAALDEGRPVYLGLSVPSDMASGYSNIRENSSTTRGGHAVEVVGYAKDTKLNSGGYWIIKNSWGTDNGDNGYQYMDFGYCHNSKAYCYFYKFTGIK